MKEVEPGVMLSGAKECLKSPEAGRNKERAYISDIALFLAMKVSQLNTTCPGFGSTQARPRGRDRCPSDRNHPGICPFSQELECGTKSQLPEASASRWPRSFFQSLLQDSCPCEGPAFRNFNVVVVTALETGGAETCAETAGPQFEIWQAGPSSPWASEWHRIHPQPVSSHFNTRS